MELINIDELVDEMQSMMETLSDLAEGVLETASIETAQETVEILKSTSPKKTGKYARAWRFTNRNKGLSKAYVVHSGKYYRLTHLLEYGHATSNGQRTRSYPHIAVAEKKAIENLTKKVVAGIENS